MRWISLLGVVVISFALIGCGGGTGNANLSSVNTNTGVANSIANSNINAVSTTGERTGVAESLDNTLLSPATAPAPGSCRSLQGARSGRERQRRAFRIADGTMHIILSLAHAVMACV